LTVMVKLPRRKATPMKLVHTGAGTAPTFGDCATVDALKAAWAMLPAIVAETDAAKAAYKARLAQVRPATVAVPPPGDAS
jgi:hypothetical protein